MRYLPSPGTLTDVRTGQQRTLRPVLLDDEGDLLRLTADTALAADLGYCTACWRPAAGHPVAPGALTVRTCPA